MGSVFENNIKALALKNKDLADRLLALIPTELPNFVVNNKTYNLEYKNILLHDKANPLVESASVFAGAVNMPVSIHIIYGLGLGYLFQIAGHNSKGTVIMYEPDLNIMRVSFSLVDFTKELLQKNVYISDKFEDIAEAIYKNSGHDNVPQILSLPSQQVLEGDNFNITVKKLRDTVGTFLLNLKYTRDKFKESTAMLLQNLPKILINETPLAEYKDIYKGQTALVISAGPTLDRNIETIKKYRDNVTIFTVNTAMRTLLENGITPDFLCNIETFNNSAQLKNLDLSKVNFITEPFSHPVLRNNFKYKQIFTHISANTPVNHFFSEITGQNIEEYWSKGTVSYTALNCARLLGYSKIILVGQDLSYIDGQCYSKDSAYKDLLCKKNETTNRWEITAKNFDEFASSISNSPDKATREAIAKDRLKNLNNSLYYVKGIQGDELPTESVYSAFIPFLSAYAENFNDRIYINTSLVGAQIDNFKNMSLEDALKDSKKAKKIKLNSPFQYDLKSVGNKLEEKLTELKSALPIIEEGKKTIKQLRNDLNRYKSATQEVLKILRKLSVNYISLSSDFTNKSKLFDYITAKDKIDLDYEMRMTQTFTYDSVLNISNKINAYYDNAASGITEVETLINAALEKIK